jgi:hypothetical protein
MAAEMAGADSDRDGDERNHRGAAAQRDARQRDRLHAPSVPGNVSHVGDGIVPDVCQ